MDYEVCCVMNYECWAAGLCDLGEGRAMGLEIVCRLLPLFLL